MAFKEIELKEGWKARMWPYGAIVINDEEGDNLIHISRYQLEEFKELIDTAIKKRDRWRELNNKK